MARAGWPDSGPARCGCRFLDPPAIRDVARRMAERSIVLLSNDGTLPRRGGRIAVISYHSLEDRAVKEAFAEHSKKCTCPPGFPVCVCGNVPILKVITRKPLVAQPDEVERNPRARSAKIRVAQRL